MEGTIQIQRAPRVRNRAADRRREGEFAQGLEQATAQRGDCWERASGRGFQSYWLRVIPGTALVQALC